jgi:thiamine-monophosphate kinase
MQSAIALDGEKKLEYVLGGGDDYELAFTAPASRRDAVRAAAEAALTPVTRIGRVEAQHGLRLLDAQGCAIDRQYASFDHFA